MENVSEKAQQDTMLLHGFSETQTTAIMSRKIIIIFCIIGVLGVASGYALSMNNGRVGTVDVGKATNTSSVTRGTVEGTEDTKTFKDTAEGTLEEGGKEGEGQYHLVRSGGETQTAYVTSSIVDLSKYVGRKVKIWGQTQKAQKVSWLMDVGRVEVLE